MKSKAYSAIKAAAEAAGAASVTQDRNVIVVSYKGSEIRISMLMGVQTGWSFRIDGLELGSERAPSGAFKRAAKIIDNRLATMAKDLEGLHNVAADKGAAIVSIEAEKVVMSYEGHEVVATKPALLWTVVCEGEQLAHGSMNAWSGLKLAIETLEERIQAAADRDNALFDAEEEVVPERPRGRLDDFCSEEEVIDDDMYDEERQPLTTFEAVRKAMDEAFQNDEVDHTAPVDELRETYRVDEAIEDHEIREALALAVRDDNAPMLVLTLGCDRVEVVVECGDTDEDPKAFNRALGDAIKELEEISGRSVTLKRVGDRDEGDGVLRAYRAPRGDYYADDVEDVTLFGVECGRFRMLEEGEAPTLPAWSRFGAFRATDLGDVRDPDSVGLFQPVAKLRASLEKMPTVRHDDGPVELYGVEAYVTLRLENGRARIHGGHENVIGNALAEIGLTHRIKLPSDMPGRRLAAALADAEALMPEVAAGFSEDEDGRIDLTPAARAALTSACRPVEDLIKALAEEREAA